MSKPDREPTAEQKKELRCFMRGVVALGIGTLEGVVCDELVAVRIVDEVEAAARSLIIERDEANRRAEKAEAECVRLRTDLLNPKHLIDNGRRVVQTYTDVGKENARLVGLLSEVATYFPPECHCDDGICRACAWSDKVHDVLDAREGKTEDGEWRN